MTPSDQARVIADYLQGTCSSLQYALEYHECEELANDDEFTATLDSLVFECEKCSWWYEIGEMAEDQDDWICQECHDDE